MSSKTYAITGIRTGIGLDGSLPERPDIDLWYQASRRDPQIHRQVDLFLQGFNAFQNENPLEKLSYFQVAGIHGLPLVPWDEVLFRDVKPESVDQGYCHHNSVIFPMWHRPYVLLVEQRIHEHIERIAREYPPNERDLYIKAADTWRLPYWDWARINDVPELCKTKTIEVNTPAGRQQIRNPCYQFTVPGSHLFGEFGISYLEDSWTDSNGQPQSYFGPFNIAKASSRYPPDADQANPNQEVLAKWYEGYVDNEKVKQALITNAEAPKGIQTLREWVARLFSLTDWTSFATTLENDPNRATNNMSLEGVHNAIHDYTGGPGFMAQVPVAAFDPIFFFHHCNIDRILAQWQFQHQTAWFENPASQRAEAGNFYTRPITKTTPEYKLHPFHKDENRTLYDSNDLRDWTKLGYTYPGLQIKKKQFTHDDGNNIKKNILKEINDNYPTRRHLIKSPIYSRHGDDHVTHNDYLVTILYNRFDFLGGSPYRVYIFLGPADETINTPSETWLTNKHLVGTIFNFSTKPEHSGIGSGGCGNCKEQKGKNLLSVGQVPITTDIVKLLESGDKKFYNPDKEALDPKVITPVLPEYLHWGVTAVNGKQIPVSTLPSLKVYVSSGKATHYTDETRLTDYKDYTLHPNVTEGRPGGYNVTSRSTLTTQG